MKIKNIIKYALLCIFFSKVILFSSVSFSSENVCDNETMNYLIENDPRNTAYNETRNDAGIHFDFQWNKEIVIIKRNNNNYPIVRYSLFDNKNFEDSKTAIIKINNQDLSQISDEELIKLTYLRGENTYQIDNGKTISIRSKPYKFNNFKLEDFKILSIQNIDTNIGILEMSFI